MGNAPPVLVWDIAGEPLKLSPEQAIHIKRASTPYQSPPATNEMAGDSEVGEAVLKENEGIRHSNDVGRYAIYHFGFHAFLILIFERELIRACTLPGDTHPPCPWAPSTIIPVQFVPWTSVEMDEC